MGVGITGLPLRADIFAHAPDPSRSPALAGAAVRQAVAASLGVPLHVAAEGGSAAAAAAAVSPADLAAAAKRTSDAVDAALDNAMRAAEAAGDRRAADASDDCAICYDSLGSLLSALTYCGACRGTVHAACMGAWSNAKRGKGEAVTCPCCR